MAIFSLHCILSLSQLTSINNHSPGRLLYVLIWLVSYVKGTAKSTALLHRPLIYSQLDTKIKCSSCLFVTWIRKWHRMTIKQSYTEVKIHRNEVTTNIPQHYTGKWCLQYNRNVKGNTFNIFHRKAETSSELQQCLLCVNT